MIKLVILWDRMKRPLQRGVFGGSFCIYGKKKVGEADKNYLGFYTYAPTKLVLNFGRQITYVALQPANYYCINCGFIKQGTSGTCEELTGVGRPPKYQTMR